jgi:hypothetical protein
VKRFLALAALLVASAVAAPAAATPKPAHPAAHHPAAHHAAAPVVPHVTFLKYAVAPADEYFGRLKLSILGIRNTIRDVGLRADADPAKAPGMLGTVGLTEDALHDWEHKYPHDTWIPPTILSLERLYAKVDTDDARAHAKDVMVWLVHDYPTSAPGKLGRDELAHNLVGAKPPSPPPPPASDPVAAPSASP